MGIGRSGGIPSGNGGLCCGDSPGESGDRGKKELTEGFFGRERNSFNEFDCFY